MIKIVRHGCLRIRDVLAGLALLLSIVPAGLAANADEENLRQELKKLPYRIVFETQREGNWKLFMMNADGSNPVSLTGTPGANELYPHVSPDGTKICFVVDEKVGKAKRRDVTMMNLDGTGRTLVAKSGRDPFWAPDGKHIVYLKDEVEQLVYTDYATKGVFFYELATGKQRQHVNPELYHLYNICSLPDCKWFVSTVHAGMGFKHGILAIEAEGTTVQNLGIPGCRPDVSPDGKKIAWGAGDCVLKVGDLELVDGKWKVTHDRPVVTSEKPIHIYHIDWSPDGKYVAFSRGPSKHAMGFAPEMIGIKAEGWNICVADAAKTNCWVPITNDGKSNKEPDWVPAAERK